MSIGFGSEQSWTGNSPDAGAGNLSSRSISDTDLSAARMPATSASVETRIDELISLVSRIVERRSAGADPNQLVDWVWKGSTAIYDRLDRTVGGEVSRTALVEYLLGYISRPNDVAGSELIQQKFAVAIMLTSLDSPISDYEDGHKRLVEDYLIPALQKAGEPHRSFAIGFVRGLEPHIDKFAALLRSGTFSAYEPELKLLAIGLVEALKDRPEILSRLYKELSDTPDRRLSSALLRSIYQNDPDTARELILGVLFGKEKDSVTGEQRSQALKQLVDLVPADEATALLTRHITEEKNPKRVAEMMYSLLLIKKTEHQREKIAEVMANQIRAGVPCYALSALADLASLPRPPLLMENNRQGVFQIIAPLLAIKFPEGKGIVEAATLMRSAVPGCQVRISEDGKKYEFVAYKDALDRRSIYVSLLTAASLDSLDKKYPVVELDPNADLDTQNQQKAAIKRNEIVTENVVALIVAAREVGSELTRILGVLNNGRRYFPDASVPLESNAEKRVH